MDQWQRGPPGDGGSMMVTAFRRAKEVAVEAAQVAGAILLQEYQQRSYRTRTKADTSLQTDADLAAEQAMLACIHTAFGDHTIESEEQGVWKVGASPYRWKIDPLDGTENFVLGLPYFSSTLLLSYDDQPLVAVVYEPVTDTLYLAEREAGACQNGKVLDPQTSAQRSCCLSHTTSYALRAGRPRLRQCAKARSIVSHTPATPALPC